MSVRLVFMGTPDFAVPSLRAVAADHEVLAVYTRADAASGRGRQLRPSPVKSEALSLGLTVVQPTTLRDHDVVDVLRAMSPDLIVVAAYGLILPAEVLAIPRLGAVNVHASLLPRWRGAAPIERALLAGDAHAGVSIMLMEEGLDTGPYCATASVEIGDMDAEQLSAALAELGAETLRSALPKIEAGGCDWIGQDESLVTYAEKIGKSDVSLSPALTAEVALRRVRASSRRAPARILLGGVAVTIEVAEPADVGLAAGGVLVNRDSVVLGVADGALRLLELKPEGRARMGAADYARGAQLDSSAIWKELL